MMKLYILITEGSEHGGKNSALLEKSVDWPTVPRDGDVVQICSDNESGGWNQYVKHVWFNDDGNVLVDLRTLVIDPDELTVKGLMSSAQYIHTWSTKTDGPRPDAAMLASGWVEG